MSEREVTGHVKRTKEKILEMVKENDIKMVDFKFVDLPGAWQHLSASVDQLEKAFEEGISFDGSSIQGFQPIHESDMLMKPDASTAFIDPFMSTSTLSLTCNIFNPATKEWYTRDPRYVAQKAEEFLRNTDITKADIAYFGPEAEFYIFDTVRFTSTNHIQHAEVDSIEAHWNSAGRDNKSSTGYLMKEKHGYIPVPPSDTCQDLRTKMFLKMQELGIPVEVHHHEVGALGQAEIRFHYGELVATADRLLLYKYIARNVACQDNRTVTFMPKPILGDNGSGMHTHQSLWRGEVPIFYDLSDNYARISDEARWYIGGILKHAPAILAFAAPSTNSYKRLVPGFEAPVSLVYSKGNRSAAVRIPLTDKPDAKRIEFRPPDPTANPYLLFSALLMAGLDGIKERENPSKLDRDTFGLLPEQLEQFASVPRSLEESLNALEKDHEFLLEGNVFTNDLLRRYIRLKREQANEVRLCPSPIEFSLYYDA
jgi:glutamine synthetase